MITMEVNILRYVSRLFPESSSMHYEANGSFSAITEKDLLLDRLQDVVNNKNSRDKAALVHELNQR